MDFGKGEVADLLQTCYRLVAYVADLLYRLVSDTAGKSPTCYGRVSGKLMYNE